MGVLSKINEVLANPGSLHPVLAIVKGIRNGAVYGAKIRFPHALVMTFLFRSGTFKEKLYLILKATYLHSKNLASAVFMYKTMMSILILFKKEKGIMDPFILAFIGGLYLYKNVSKIGEQMTLYTLSRILVAFAKLLVKKGYIKKPNFNVWPLFAALVWGSVLWLFEFHHWTLQDSLQNSMFYLYKDSNTFNTLKNFLWHNK